LRQLAELTDSGDLALDQTLFSAGFDLRHAAKEAVKIEKAAQAERLVVVVHVKESADGAMRVAEGRMRLLIAHAFDGAAEQRNGVERKPVVGKAVNPVCSPIRGPWWPG